jgi:hypothetical protein
MLTKKQRVQRVKFKLKNDLFGNTNTTTLTEEEVLKLWHDMRLPYKLVVWSTQLATYFKVEKNSN